MNSSSVHCQKDTASQDAFLLSIIEDVLREDEAVVTDSQLFCVSEMTAKDVSSENKDPNTLKSTPNDKNDKFEIYTVTKVDKMDVSEGPVISPFKDLQEKLSQTHLEQTMKEISPFTQNKLMFQELETHDMYEYHEEPLFGCISPPEPYKFRSSQNVDDFVFPFKSEEPLIKESSQFERIFAQNETEVPFSPIKIQDDVSSPLLEIKDIGDPMNHLKEVYFIECAKFQCQPNSLVIKLLENPDLIKFDMSNNFLNEYGIHSVISVIKKLNSCLEVNFYHNGMRDGSCIALCKMLMDHPTITSIDLSYNPIYDGKILLDLVQQNLNITKLNLGKTKISQQIQEAIKQELSKKQRF